MKFNGELLHFGIVRLRAVGHGNLLAYLRSLDDTHNVQLPTFVLAATTNREPTQLVNFIDQRAQLELRTEAIDDFMSVSKIVIYIKPVATGYPQT